MNGREGGGEGRGIALGDARVSIVHFVSLCVCVCVCVCVCRWVTWRMPLAGTTVTPATGVGSLALM